MPRSTLIALVIAAVVSLGGWIQASSAQTNLIPNSSFEHDKDHDGIPDNWARQGTRDSRLLLEQEGYTGTRAISITGKGTWSCRIQAPVSQGWYILSFWVKRDGFVDGEYPLVRILDKEITFDELFTWGRWVRLSRLLYLGEDQETGAVAFINPGMRHRVWFDEVSLIPFAVHPLSPRQGEVLSQGPPLFAWTMPEDKRIYEIRIELSGKQGLQKTYTTYSPQGNLYWLPEQLLPGRYHWRIRVYHNGLRIAASQKIDFTVSQRLLPAADTGPSLLPQRSLDGIFPLGIYGAPIEALPELKATGFNAIQTYRRDTGFLRRFTKQAQGLGLQVLIPPPDREGKETLHAFLQEIKQSPAMLAWYLADEPEGSAIPPSSIWRWRQFLRSYTPFPGALVLVRAKQAWDYAPAADILMVDPYPIPRMPVTWLSDSLEQAKKWAQGKPVWAVIQAFAWSASPLEDDSRSWGRYPTYEEERCLSYLAVVHGAQGLFYYTFAGGSYRIKDHPRHWAEVKQVVSELRSIYPLLLAPFASADKLKIDHPQIHWAVKQVGKGETDGLIEEGYYLIAVNTVNSPLTATFSIPPLFDDKVRVLFEKRKVSVKRDRLKDAFEPYAVHIYGPLQLDRTEGS
jgi:hypothetical protein